MTKLTKKIFAGVLSLALVLSLMPISGGGVSYAAGSKTTSGSSTTTTNSSTTTTPEATTPKIKGTPRFNSKQKVQTYTEAFVSFEEMKKGFDQTDGELVVKNGDGQKLIETPSGSETIVTTQKAKDASVSSPGAVVVNVKMDEKFTWTYTKKGYQKKTGTMVPWYGKAADRPNKGSRSLDKDREKEEDKKKKEEAKKEEAKKEAEKKAEEKAKNEDKNVKGSKDAITVNGKVIKDVKKTDWFAQSVIYVIDKGIMKGTGDNEFSPNMDTTRAMVVTMLYRLDANEPKNLENKFSDVEKGSWYADPVNWAANEKIVNGMGDGSFKPNDKLTREQLVTVMYRYAEYKKYDVSKLNELKEYKDVNKVSKWAMKPMQWAVENGIISGMTKDTLAPQEGATRAQMATIFKRFMEKFVK